MNFRTGLSIPHAPFAIEHGDGIFMAGSCFAENISARLLDAKFRVCANPTGILFNPASIARMFAGLENGKRFAQRDLRRGGSLWFGWQHHGSFSDESADAALEKMNRAFEEGREALSAARYVIITFGTAWIYRLAESGEVVANCHRQPAAAFVRERLSVADITREYDRLLASAFRDKTAIFTVSPVRHLKDGFAENSLSKAILRAAVGELVERYANAHYFPAFELLTDDLRDYRFYAEDMVHPSPQAIGYVWEKFARWALGERSLALLPRVEKLSAAMRHRILNPGGDTRKFASNMLALAGELEKELPQASFAAEKEYFGRLL